MQIPLRPARKAGAAKGKRAIATDVQSELAAVLEVLVVEVVVGEVDHERVAVDRRARDGVLRA